MAIANCQILERVCATAGSDLFRGRSADGSTVLLKLPAENADPVQFALLKREHLLLQSLNVAGIAKPLTLIDERIGPVLVLEDFAGESLEAVLGRAPRMDLPVCLRIGRHLADTFAGIDAAQVIHRDIRPANLLVEPGTGRVLLVDFSMATAKEASTVPTREVTAPAGDWAYVSPEQTGRMNRPVDYRTDCYSMGVMLYRMLTGQLPFQANDPLEWTHCHIARMPIPPTGITPEVPQPVSDIVMKMLAKLPEDRYQSAQGLKADLDRCLVQWRTSGQIEPFPLGREDIPVRFHAPHKLYGRRHEAARLLGAFERTAATGEAMLAIVSGYSGIGKSTLVEALRRPIVANRGYFISGKFDQGQRYFPYAAIIKAFRELVQQLLAESEARVAGWRQRIQAAVGTNGQLIVDVLPQVELIIGAQLPVSALPPTKAQNRFRVVFRQFVMGFASEAHPLVLFLDDLQWIDPASLTLVEDLITHPDTRYLLLVGAFRDNEVSATHPLMTSVERIRQNGTSVNELQLAPLSVVDLNRLVADTLRAPSAAACEPLTRLVRERTGGNPFFFIQFLDVLHQEGLLRHDAQHRAWRWNLDQIRAKNFAGNAVDLTVGKLRQLRVAAQETLRLAACLGNTFDLRHVALVSGNLAFAAWQGVREVKVEVEQALAAAARENLIVLADGTGKFLHDRIQQAAYALIPDAERAGVHLSIGRVLLANLTADELAEHVFDVANQFNRGATLLTGHDEKVQIAALDLSAGRRAKSSAAYASACVYLAAGMDLLDDGNWVSHRDLMFSLRLERAECEYLTGRADKAEQLIEELLRRCVSRVDHAAVCHMKVRLHIVKSENRQAVDSVLTCLRLFGIDLPAHPSQEQVEAEYEAVWRNLAGRPVESLIDVPLMTDPELQVAMRLLSTLYESAYFIDFQLLCLHLCRMVNISLLHGSSGASAYACFGFILGPVFRRYRDGYRFARLACDLVGEGGFPVDKALVYIATGHVAFWTQPIETVIDFHRAAFRTATETGDLTTACYSAFHCTSDLLLRGDPLETVWRESQRSLDFVRKAGYLDAADAIVCNQRFIATMQGHTAKLSTFSDSQFDEAAFEAQLTDDRMSSMVCTYWIFKLHARFLAGDYVAALDAAQRAQPQLWVLVGLFQSLDYFYYTALTLAALYENGSAGEQVAWHALLDEHREQLREWADTYPPTFADKHALVSAEIARIEGRNLDAMCLYEVAIQAASDQGFVQNEGIAHELAAGFCRARGWASAGRAHLNEARSCFERWGAHGKVRQLDARISPIREVATSRLATPVGNVVQLDLLSVAKASQAISSHIVLDDLVDTLMHILLESAGAQTGRLLLAHNASLALVAEASVAQQTVHVRRHLGDVSHGSAPPESAAREEALPDSIVNYVQRCQERVLLDDATQANPFSADEYLTRRQPKSVLCLPLMRRSELIGLLYLENNLAIQAFTPERITVLELLASQAAITLENARLYRDLAEREARIRRLVEANIVGIFTFHLDGQILEANEAFLRIVGYDREDLESGRMCWTDMTPPEWLERDNQRIAELTTTGTLQPFEKEYFRKDGSRAPVLIGVATFEVGQHQGVGFALDLTVCKRAEAEVRESEERYREVQMALAHSNRAATMGQLTASIAHEVRQPITAVATYASAASRWLDARPANLNEVRQALDGIVYEATRAGGIISGIRDLVRKAPPRKDRVDINEAVVEVIELTRGEAAKYDVSVLTALGDALPLVLGDRVQLQQVMLNLIVNALEAMGSTSTSPREILISTTVDLSDGVSIVVRDSGPGLPPDEFSRVFDPFYTTKENGLGMGLSICRSIVETHGGRLWACKNEPRGAVFQFTLPAGGGE
ncbi:PAS domain S-box-containing protein [Paraburkholderia sp. GAS38]|uniref:trifunctional serine/threonine-protein kinase/ATP-binding protein/sensor histidine kinase n=1 Tax=Paraburkholderia sp. GAS38 TaxID=3035133 RepID=UPI003D1C14DF